MTALLGHMRQQQQVRDAIARDSLHHAYLLEGPKGVGKRTFADWLVRYANCEADAERPCGTCGTCVQIAAGTHPDVIVLEPDPGSASQTISVEQVREVIRKAGYHRYNARQRFIVIDPAEALPTNAANALLKTLEEPPTGTGFLLVAHNASALLPTINSRCQRLRFGAVPMDAIERWLTERGLDDVAGAARLSQGCPGKALQLAEGELQERRALRDEVLQVLGGRLGDLFAWSEKQASGKRQESTARIEHILDILEDLLRDVAVVGSSSALPLLNDDCRPVVERWTSILWPGGVQELSRTISEARQGLALYVTAKTQLDAVLATFATELGPARS